MYDCYCKTLQFLISMIFNKIDKVYAQRKTGGLQFLISMIFNGYNDAQSYEYVGSCFNS